MVSVQFIYMLVLLCGGIFISLSTRRIHSRVAWGELRWLSIAVCAAFWHFLAPDGHQFPFQLYNLTFWCLILALLMGLLRDQIVPMTVVVCLCFLFMVGITAGLVYGSKVYFIVYKRALLEAGGDADFSTNFSPDSIANAKDE
jgi:hypothetical protein